MIRSREARQRAHEVLLMAKVKEAPVPVEQIAELLDFSVLRFPFPDTTSGLTYIEHGVKSIGVNSNHAETRQRFSIAHELGHYLHGHEDYDHGKTHIEDRPTWMDPQNRQEVEADEFAAELLMPEHFLRQDLATFGLDVLALAGRYRVSEQAMWIQLVNLKLASQYARS